MRKLHSKWDTLAHTLTFTLAHSFIISFIQNQLLFAWTFAHCFESRLSQVSSLFLSLYTSSPSVISKSHTAEIIQKKKICIYTIARQSIRLTEIYLHDGTGEWTELKLNPASHPMWTCIFAGFFAEKERERERERDIVYLPLAAF